MNNRKSYEITATIYVDARIPRLMYEGKELRPLPPDNVMEIEVQLTATRTAYRAATHDDPEEGGEIEDLVATYDGQEIELSTEDERRAIDTLAEVTE
jgi:hypothetical protein